MSVKHGMYYTPMVREFYANYVSLLYHGTRLVKGKLVWLLKVTFYGLPIDTYNNQQVMTKGQPRVLVSTLLFGFPIDIGRIIVDEIQTRVIRPAMSLPFPCLITSLWRAAAVPILVGIDNQIVVPTKFYIEMMKNESWLEMQVHKTDTEVADWG
ncbi:hypothetical protein KY284_010497 [Solanum tuberosum]|nr:hypothetical protein KY284_010497 [Solanum tuberosum]